MANPGRRTGGFVSGNVADGNQATYWESAAIGGGQWVQADLGSATSIDQVVLKLPTGWGARTQTLSVQGSNDGVAFATIVGSSAQSFNGSSNTVTLNFTAFTTKIVRVNITANSGWTAAQLSELEVYGAGVSATNLAAGKAMSESGHAQDYVAARANDGNATGTSYWEGPANSYPQWLRVDLGSSVPVNRVVVKVPTGWGPVTTASRSSRRSMRVAATSRTTSTRT